MVREGRRVVPFSGAFFGEEPESAAVISAGNPNAGNARSAGARIQRFVELAIRSCGSAAALAREVGVKPPTVSQWRSGHKRPDAVHLLRIQDLARRAMPFTTRRVEHV